MKRTTPSAKRPKSRSSQHKTDANTSVPASLDDPFAAREAGRYERPITSREAILQLLEHCQGPQKLEEIAELLNLNDPERKEALSRRLSAMVRDGQLVRNRRGGLAPVQAAGLIVGTVIAHPEGFGFLHPETGGDDLFLSPVEMRKVLHGDRVLVNVTGVDWRGRCQANISRVLERGLSRLVGHFSIEMGICYVVPDDRRIQHTIQIPPEADGGARDGQLVVCELTQAPDVRRLPIGKVISVLGERLTPSLIVKTAIYGHDLPHEFPPEALEQAQTVPTQVENAHCVGRTDLRALPLITIDGKDARDFDDAVYCQPHSAGFRLVVAIADVAHYVPPGSALDNEAQHRATSVYFPGYVLPMLPETLSNGICSLRPKEDRLCLVCDMQVNLDGEVVQSQFYEAVIHSHARLTYNQVWAAIQGESDAKTAALLPQIQHLHQLYQALARARQQRGAIEFESIETRFMLDNRGEVTQASVLVRNEAHKLIEECMIAANVQAARYLLAAQVPAPFRIHERPPESKYTDLLEFLKEFKLKLPKWSQVKPADFTQLLNQVRQRSEASLLESVLLRSQSLAVYSPENHGHFGLALDAYAHFTSPIRRYPDLLVHRAIKHVLAGEKVENYRYSSTEMSALARQCSQRERRSDEAQREVDERYRAAWMEQHIGSEFDGVISGVTGFGLFVELEHSKVSGLVHVTQLPHDYYRFDPLRKTLSGERRAHRFRLGDKVRICVLKASMLDRKIDFRLVSATPSAAGRKKGQNNAKVNNQT